MKATQLDVDFIGGQESLTKEEETLLSEFFKKRKEASKKSAPKQKNLPKPTSARHTQSNKL